MCEKRKWDPPQYQDSPPLIKVNLSNILHRNYFPVANKGCHTRVLPHVKYHYNRVNKVAIIKLTLITRSTRPFI